MSFREMIRTELGKVVDPGEMQKFQDAHPFLDARRETLVNWRLYWPDDPSELPRYGTLAAELSQDEMGQLWVFIEAVRRTDDWDQIAQAAMVLWEQLAFD